MTRASRQSRHWAKQLALVISWLLIFVGYAGAEHRQLNSLVEVCLGDLAQILDEVEWHWRWAREQAESVLDFV